MTPISFRYASLLVLFFAACGDDGGGSTAAVDSGSGDTGTLTDSGSGESDTTADTGTDTGADTSTDTSVGPRCDDDERRVGDRCFSNQDRSCLSTADCRAEEEEVCDLNSPNRDGFGLCRYTPPAPLVCPGAPGCATAEGSLQAGFARRSITPQGWESARPAFMDQGLLFTGDVRDPSTFCDCGLDMVCPATPAFADCVSVGTYAGPDADGTEGDGEMQGIWLAGFDFSRPAQLCAEERTGAACDAATNPDCCVSRQAHDNVEVNVVVFDKGETRIAYVVIDAIGFFYSDVLRIKKLLPASLGVDQLLISSTHDHEAPDTMGQWGPGTAGSDLPDISGVNNPWMATLYAKVVEGVTEATGALAPVDLYASEVNTGWDGVSLDDYRAPYILNDLMVVLQFVRDGGDPANPDDTVGSMVNWHNHPEVMDDRNVHITADYPGATRRYFSSGMGASVHLDDPAVVEPALTGLGGMTLFTTGSCGGITGPGSVSVKTRDGRYLEDPTWEKNDALGQRLATIGLTNHAANRVRIEDESLSFTHLDFLADVQNGQFHQAIFGLKLFARDVYNWRFSDGLVGPDVFPQTRTAVTRLQIGGVTFQTFPGELFSETMTGGYKLGNTAKNPIVGDPERLDCAADDLLAPDGSGEAAGFPCLVPPDHQIPPDLDAAPTSGFLYRELPGQFIYAIGLGNDELGYIVPPYNFVVDAVSPYYIEPYDHYEETNSVGDRMLPNLLSKITELWGGAVDLSERR